MIEPPAPAATSAPAARRFVLSDAALRRIAAAAAVFAVVELLLVLAIARIGDVRFSLDLNLFVIAFLAIVAGFSVSGAIVARQQPRNVIGWVMLVFALAVGFDLVAYGYAAIGLPPRDQLPLAEWALWASGSIWVLAIGLPLGMFLLRFPDGAITRRGSWAERLMIVAAVVFLIGDGLAPGQLDPEQFPGIANPLGAPEGSRGLLDALASLGNAGIVIGSLFGVVAIVARYRRAGSVERAQIRWIALIALGVAPLLTIAALQLGWISDTSFALGFLLVALLPVAILVAITRYHLYDIDRIVNRTVLYGSLSAILAGAFAASITLSQRMFVAATGETSDAAVVASTLIVTALYTPARRRIERVVDLLFKYDSRRFGEYRSELHGALEMLDPPLAARRLVSEAVTGLAATGGAVLDHDDQPLATKGDWPCASEVRLTIGEPHNRIGWLVVGPRHDGQPHDPRGVADLGEISRLAGRAMAIGRASDEAEPRAARPAIESRPTLDAQTQ